MNKKALLILIYLGVVTAMVLSVKTAQKSREAKSDPRTLIADCGDNGSGGSGSE
jgi:hypothetical protein